MQNVCSGETVKVCFVDYGNVEEVPLDKIRQISSSFLKLPFQGIKCWLSGGFFIWILSLLRAIAFRDLLLCGEEVVTWSVLHNTLFLEACGFYLFGF